MNRSIKPILGTLKIIGVLFVLICLIIAFDVWRGSNLTPEQKKAIADGNRRAAEALEAESRVEKSRSACWSALLQTLHDPYSARKEQPSPWPVLQTGGKYVRGDTYIVTMTGRAKNIYGAYMLQRWKCEARIEGDQWRVMSIQPAN